MKRPLIVLLLLITGSVVLTSQAGNTLPPEKQAIEQQYSQERQAGSQNPAPKDANAPYPITQELPYKMGIIRDCDPGFSASDAYIVSCWHGIVNGAKAAVYTGAEGEAGDPQQGLVVVDLIPGYPSDVVRSRIQTPVKDGPVSIVAAKDNILTLVSSGHYVLTFDVNTQTFTSVVLDNTPPVINGMPSVGCTLWPPNHKLIQVATVTASDDTMVDPSTFSVTGTSNEPSDPSDPDIVIESNGNGGFIIKLRAERLGTGTGRIYTLTAKATDLVGNTATSTAVCRVPHDQGK